MSATTTTSSDSLLAVTSNLSKIIACTLLALAAIGALIVDSSAHGSWAVPLLSVLIGYIVGNADVTSRNGPTAPIISKG